MLKSRFYIISFLMVSWAAVVHSQSQGDFYIRRFSTENGMPSNGIKGMQWDEETGFLWIATEAGVTRFNGMEFKTFTKDNTPGLATERTTFMIRNQQGKIYAADLAGNVFIVDNNNIHLYQESIHDNNWGIITRLKLSMRDTILQKKIIGTWGSPNTIPFRKLIEISDTACVLLNEENKFFYITTHSGIKADKTIEKIFTTAFKVNDAVFLVDNQNFFYRLDKHSGKLLPATLLNEKLQPLNIAGQKKILYWENGMKNPVLFIGTNAWILDEQNGEVIARLICTEVPAYSFIRSAQYSIKEKLLFIATDSKGLIIINPNRVTPAKKETGIDERNAYYAQVELSNGSILTNEGHIIGNTSTAPGKLPISGKFTFSTYRVNDSLLFYAQNGKDHLNCLHSYNYNTHETHEYSKIILYQMFGMLASGKDLYIATNDGIGIIKDDSIHYLSRYLSGSRDGQAPNDMLELSPGIFVMATCEGLMRFNVNSRKTDTLLKSDGYCIRAIRKYGDYLFIGTYGNGYFMMKNGLIKPMPLDKNKYLLYAHCFINDDKGFCWISTNRGLFKAQLSDLVDAYEKNIPQVYYHYFGRNDGMDITEMNGGCAPCALVLRNKDISFPTMDGLLWVNPEKATPLLPEGNIFIDEIMADNKKADPDSSALISLSPDVHEVSIKVGFSAWCNKENIYLEYQLNNNEKWQSVDVNNGALIKLVNLPQGDYTVRIRKQNGFGTNNYSYKDIRFSIATPWYSKWWFFLLSFACLIGMLMLFGWFRTRQYIIRQQKLEQQVAEKTSELQHKNEVLEKNDSIKTRLISIISHDIVTPLKFLTVAGKNLLEKRIMMTEELQQETIREMANTSQELQLLSTNILNWIKYQNENRRLSKEQFNVYELVKQVNGVLNSLAKQKNIRLLNEVEHGLQLYQYFEPLKILVYNLVSNAINFSEQGIISISNSSTDGSVFILVKDEGVGMTADQVHNIMANEFIVSSANIDNRKGNGLGYLIIKDLLKMMGATMQIDSKKGVGTTVTISIPLSKEELRVKS